MITQQNPRKLLLKKKGFKSVEAFAYKTGYSHSHITGWLSGKSVSENAFNDFAKALKLSPKALATKIRANHT